MTIHVNIPPGVEQAMKSLGRDAAAEFTEAGMVELYRQGTISHGQLAEGLGVSRAQADEILRRHKVSEDLLTSSELNAQLDAMRRLVG